MSQSLKCPDDATSPNKRTKLIFHFDTGIRLYANSQDSVRFNRLRGIIERPETVSTGMNAYAYQSSASPAANSLSNGAHNYSTPGPAMPSYNRPNGYGMSMRPPR